MANRGTGTRRAEAVQRPREQMPEEQRQGVKPHRTRWQRRRAAEQAERVQRRQARRRPRPDGPHGDSAVSSWARESWVLLVKLNTKLRPGTELETVADRKKLIIARNEELARRLGVSNAELANLTHAERAALSALKAGGWPGKAIEGALRKTGARIVRAAA